MDMDTIMAKAFIDSLWLFPVVMAGVTIAAVVLILIYKGLTVLADKLMEHSESNKETTK